MLRSTRTPSRPLGGHGRGHRIAPILASAPKTAAPKILKFSDVRDGWHGAFDDKSWNGYVGNWYTFAPNVAASSQPAIRSFRFRDASRRILDQTNVYSGSRPGVTKTREVDGLNELRVVYEGHMVDPDIFEDPVTPSRASVVVVHPNVLVVPSRFCLPPAAVTGPPPPEVLAAQKEAEEDDKRTSLPIRSMSWGLEAIIKDGDCRWSFPMVYDAKSGVLTRTSLIQEYGTTADPHTPYVLTALKGAIREPRPQLPEDPATWVPHGSVGRRLGRLRMDLDGKHLLLDDSLTEPVLWDSPPAPAPGSPPESDPLYLARLPDAMYIRVPKSIAAGAEPAGSTLRLECGGLLRRQPESGTAGTLARVVVQYDRVTGLLIEMCYEEFPVQAVA